jgi:outer membrane biosynthesis protein TonB
MFALREYIEACSGTMDLRRIIPTDVTASAIAHLSLLALLLLFSDVHPFGSVTAEPMEVNIVAPQDIPEAPEPEKKPEPVPTPTPLPDFTLLDKPATPTAPQPAAKSQPSGRQQKQAALAPPPSAPQAAAAQPQPPAAQPAPAYKQPEPDVTLKYQVLLGLPPDLSPALPPTPPASPQARDRAGDNFDAPATQTADVASSVTAAFRRHLRTCSKLPAGLAGADDVRVKLRVLMTQDGKLAADPILIEASASMKGPLLMQGAISALQACQPYAMLPADRYGEWKVLDLSFTPQDFGGAS